MKKILLILIFPLAAYHSVKAQNIGINSTGATPNASAMLDIVAADKGLLIPRVALTSTTSASPVTTPATSLLVYNTATAGTVPNNVVPGYYYWNGSSWVSFLSANTSGWNLTGNNSINATTNFVGTIANTPLVFRSNNVSQLELGTRNALGLVQAYTDYTDVAEKVAYVRSALQFESAAAQFYKPKMWVDTDGNFRVKGSSAGTDYFEFGSTGTSNSGGFEFIIGDDGDEPILFKSYHYINGMSEIMRLQSGRMAVGSNSFDATNPEKLLIDAGVTTSYNLMTGKGSIDNYLQINVKNSSAGGSASSDVVATSNNGTESVNYIDMGINSGSYTNVSSPVLGGANTAYLYTTGNDFVIGNGTAAKPIRFFTGGFAAANERMRIDGTGKVGIGNTTPSEVLDITGNVKISGAFMPGNTAGTSGYVLTSAGSGVTPTWTNPATLASSTAWALDGNTLSAIKKFGTISAHDVPFITNNTEKMRLFSAGSLALGATTLDATNPEKLLVNAGTTTSYNLMNAKGSINNYMQINIQNQSSGAAASSDLVATANNGSETANYVDLGINSSGYSSTGVLGGANNAYLYSTGNDFVIGNATSAKDLLFFTNGTAATDEKVRINAAGNVGIGTSLFNVSNPEKLLVHGGAATTSYNLINAKGTINNYLQMNLQNLSSGAAASSDIVATANNGTETVNFIDMGINSGGYSTTGVLGGANNAYLYSTGNDFVIGNATTAKDLIFFTNGTNTGDEKMRISADGNVGIGTSDFDPSAPEKLLIDAGDQNTAVSATGDINDFLEINVQNISNGNKASSDLVATANNGTENSVYIDMGINSAGYANGASNILNGGNLAYIYANANDFKIGNGTPNMSLIFFTNPSSGSPGTNTANGIERMRISEAGNVGVNTATPNSTLSINGSISYAYRTIGSSTTITATDRVIIYTGNGSHTWTLPAASTVPGRVYRLVNQGQTNVTLSQSVTTANATTTTTLPFGATGNFEILSDGSVWRKIN